MKNILVLSFISGAVLLSSSVQAQYKYTPKTPSPTTNKKTYQFTPVNSQKEATTPVSHTFSGVNTTMEKKAPPVKLTAHPTTDPPIINDLIDVYSENPELLESYLIVHLGDFAVPHDNSNSLQFILLSNPDYDYHNQDHLEINVTNYKNVHDNTAYYIPLYTKSNNHWAVTYRDFVTKWFDSAHTHIKPDYWFVHKGGDINIVPGWSSRTTISKLILVLKFTSGTKTIVWNNVRFSGQTDLSFNQLLQNMPVPTQTGNGFTPDSYFASPAAPNNPVLTNVSSDIEFGASTPIINFNISVKNVLGGRVTHYGMAISGDQFTANNNYTRSLQIGNDDIRLQDFLYGGWIEIGTQGMGTHWATYLRKLVLTLTFQNGMTYSITKSNMNFNQQQTPGGSPLIISFNKNFQIVNSQ